MVSFCRSQNFQFLAENHGLYSKAFCRIFPVEPFRAHNSSLEGAIKLRLNQNAPLEMLFLVQPFVTKTNFSDFG